MSTIPLSKLFDEWHKEPEYMREYEALEEEFALAAALIRARADSGLTQEEIAVRMAQPKAPSPASKAANRGRRQPRWRNSPRRRARGCG